MGIIIGFSKPKKKLFPFFSWAIRLFDQTPYSHVYVRWTTKVGVDIVYQASHTSVHFMSKKLFDEQVHVISEYEIQITDDKYDDLIRYCLTNAGMQYGVMQIVGIAIAYLFKMPKNPLNKGYVCSELVGSILSQLGAIKPEKDLNLLTPKDIEQLLIDNNIKPI